MPHTVYLEDDLDALRPSPEDIERRRHLVREAVLAASSSLDPTDLETVEPRDLTLILLACDLFFFRGGLGVELACAGGTQTSVRLDSGDIEGGGTTEHYGDPEDDEQLFEIVVSSPWLRRAFASPDARPLVTGRVCVDPLDGVQRLLEREVAFVAASLCAAPGEDPRKRADALAVRIFGHRAR